MCSACTPTESGSSTTTGTSATSESTADAPETSTSESTTAADASTSSTESTTGGSDSTSTGASTCPDVEFVYNIAYDPTAGNTCDAVLGNTNTCAVTQTECELSWGCNGAFENLLPVGPIDADGIYIGEGMYMGTPVVCTLTFDPEPYGFEFDCTGREIACTGGGF